MNLHLESHQQNLHVWTTYLPYTQNFTVTLNIAKHTLVFTGTWIDMPRINDDIAKVLETIQSVDPNSDTRWHVYMKDVSYASDEAYQVWGRCITSRGLKPNIFHYADVDYKNVRRISTKAGIQVGWGPISTPQKNSSVLQ